MSLSLYIHIPFCKSKCFYCSFTSFEKKDQLIEPYLKALKKEASRYKGTTVNTVYIGGGTPTYLNIDQIKFLFSIITSNFSVAHDAEVTVEANPATFDLEKARALHELGVSRVSLGIQSLNDAYLKYLGRPHSRAEALSSFEILKSAGFHNISLDLIYSLPGQTQEEIKKDVSDLASLDSEHVSLYTLTISEGSEFYKRRIESCFEEEQAQHYRLVVNWLKKKDFHLYEVSNFAKKGFECRHNLNYWHGGNYIGLGVGAHSHRDGHRFWNNQDMESYLTMIKKSGCAKTGEEKLTTRERLMETLLIGLRLTEGVDIEKLESRFQSKLAKEKITKINDFLKHGFLVKEGNRIKTTLAGTVVLDEICARLI